MTTLLYRNESRNTAWFRSAAGSHESEVTFDPAEFANTDREMAVHIA
jgi:hypothetical protein